MFINEIRLQKSIKIIEINLILAINHQKSKVKQVAVHIIQCLLYTHTRA